MKLTENQQVQIMIDLDDKELYTFIKTNKQINEIYNKNKEYIFLKKLKKIFKCVQKNQELYRLMKTMDKSFETYNIEANITSRKS